MEHTVLSYAHTLYREYSSRESIDATRRPRR
jgi:ABC-type transport system substrate-binding protein